MIRFTLNLAAAVCGVLFLATLTLWARSYWVLDSAFNETANHGYFLASGRGRVGFVRLPQQYRVRGWYRGSYSIQSDYARSQLATLLKDPGTSHLGPIHFGADSTTSWRGPGMIMTRHWLVVHDAAFASLFLIPCAARLWWLRRRRQRIRRGFCTTCGYDLRASPDRCPECGSAAGDSTPLSAAHA